MGPRSYVQYLKMGYDITLVYRDEGKEKRERERVVREKDAFFKLLTYLKLISLQAYVYPYP